MMRGRYQGPPASKLCLILFFSTTRLWNISSSTSNVVDALLSCRSAFSSANSKARCDRSAAGWTTAKYQQKPRYYDASSHCRARHRCKPLFVTSDNGIDASFPDVTTMRIKDLKEELESYGISTKSFLEKSELLAAVEKARSEGRRPESRRSSAERDDPISSAASMKEQLQKEIEKCQLLKVSELRNELAQLGISTKTFVEKSEFVRALAEARVGGVKSKESSQEEETVLVAENVEVLGANDIGPQKRSTQSAAGQQQQSSSPFGGSMGGFSDMFQKMAGGGGPSNKMADMFSGMGGTNMADMFSGMGGTNMADMFGNMGKGGGMPNMSRIQELMKNPKVMQILSKAQSNPKLMSAVQECMSNPMAMAKYQNDPEIRALLNELRPFIQ